jgi:hypothetical protein
LAGAPTTHGVGPGHPDWPELSCAIVAFGGSVQGFRAGAPPCGLQWWEIPDIVSWMIAGFGAPAAATGSLLQPLTPRCRCEANSE